MWYHVQALNVIGEAAYGVLKGQYFSMVLFHAQPDNGNIHLVTIDGFSYDYAGSDSIF